MSMHCECCRDSRETAEYATERRYLARLCANCASKGHTLDRCLLCGEPCWHCARVAHVAAVHPRTLEKLANDPFKELNQKPVSPYRHLGKLLLPC